MISAFKKIVGSDAQSANSTVFRLPDGVRAMGQTLQQKFSRGISYNMKVVIKGERNTGKSCLFYRLQGYKFTDVYVSTEEIQVASIHWNYKETDDVVKVDVWDIVDKSKKKVTLGLKLSNNPDENLPPPDSQPTLDAEFLDVYKGTHAVIFLFDLTKRWTLDYVLREAPKVPQTIPILILANFRDLTDRVVFQDELDSLQRNLAKSRSSLVVVTESSVKVGFGLKFIYDFLNIPFLDMQYSALETLLRRNREESKRHLAQYIKPFEKREENDYEMFLSAMAAKNAAKLAKRNSSEVDTQSSAQVSSASAISPTVSSPPFSPNALPVSKSPVSSNGISSKIGRFFSSKKTPVNEVSYNSNKDPFYDSNDQDLHKESNKDSTDSDVSYPNPMVASFYDDIDSEPEAIKLKRQPRKSYSTSSDDNISHKPTYKMKKPTNKQKVPVRKSSSSSSTSLGEPIKSDVEDPEDTDENHSNEGLSSIVDLPSSFDFPPKSADSLNLKFNGNELDFLEQLSPTKVVNENVTSKPKKKKKVLVAVNSCEDDEMQDDTQSKKIKKKKKKSKKDSTSEKKVKKKKKKAVEITQEFERPEGYESL